MIKIKADEIIKFIEKDKEIKLCTLHPIKHFMRQIGVNKKKRLKITLEFDAEEILEDPRNVTKFKGNLWLLWVEKRKGGD